MFLRPLQWFRSNLSTMFLALVLAVFVWVSAMLAADPNETREYQQPVNLELIGQDAGLIIINKIPFQVRLTLKAPQSIWVKLDNNPNLLRAWIDLSGLSKGEYVLPVKTQVGISPHKVLFVDPAEIQLTLERLLVKTFPVQIVTSGDLTLGYRKGLGRSDPAQVTVLGPESSVSQVASVIAHLDISGSSETLHKNVALSAVDQVGNPVTSITITPQNASIDQEIILLGGYRNVVVKIITSGQVADGYWLTNISVSPPNVTVFSPDPQLVNSLPGFVETEPVDLTGLNDDVDIRATLNLSKGVELAGEKSVLVRLSIAALEGSLPISLRLEVIGLPPEYSATVSPSQIDLLITGPLPILNNLKPGGIRVSINLSGLQPGTYQVSPVVDLLPSQVQVAAILPENVEVKIVRSLKPVVTPTPSPTPVHTSVLSTVIPTP
jgi:YbbR domain-containing protein